MIELVALFAFLLFLSLAGYHVAQLSTKETPFEEGFSSQEQNKNATSIGSKYEQGQKKKAKRIKTRKVDISYKVPKVKKVLSSRNSSNFIVKENMPKFNSSKKDKRSELQIVEDPTNPSFDFSAVAEVSSSVFSQKQCSIQNKITDKYNLERKNLSKKEQKHETENEDRQCKKNRNENIKEKYIDGENGEDKIENIKEQSHKIQLKKKLEKLAKSTNEIKDKKEDKSIKGTNEIKDKKEDKSIKGTNEIKDRREDKSIKGTNDIKDRRENKSVKCTNDIRDKREDRSVKCTDDIRDKKEDKSVKYINEIKDRREDKSIKGTNEIKDRRGENIRNNENIKEQKKKGDKEFQNMNNAKVKGDKRNSDVEEYKLETDKKNDIRNKTEKNPSDGKRKREIDNIKINSESIDQLKSKDTMKLTNEKKGDIQNAKKGDNKNALKSRGTVKSGLKEMILEANYPNISTAANTHQTQKNLEKSIYKLSNEFSPSCKEEIVQVTTNSTSSVTPMQKNEFEVETERVKRKMKDENGKKKPLKDENSKKKQIGDELSRLVSMIQKCHLSSLEIQTLIEALLNKQQLIGNLGGEWVAKGKIINPLSQLRRQLEESEARIKEQTETHSALLAKISDLRTELNSEKSRNNRLKKQLDDSGALLQQKLDSTAAAHREQLLAKLNETKIVLNKEYQTKLIQQQQIISRENEIQRQNFQASILELEKQLQQVEIVHQESENRYQQVTNALTDTQHQLKTSTKERDELVQTYQNYQQHLTLAKDQISQQEVEFNSRLYEVQQKLNSSEASNKQIMSQLHQSFADKDLLDQELRNLENVQDRLSQNQGKLNKTIDEKIILGNQLIASESETHNLREVIKNLKLENERLKEEHESLGIQNFRPAVEGQENGNYQEPISNKHLNSLESPIYSLTKQIAKLKEELIYLKAKNTDSGSLEKEAKSLPVVKKTKIVEKIIEKVVQDPYTLKELEEYKEKNAFLKMKVKNLTEENLVLENNLKASSSVEDQSTIIDDLQLENKNLTEKISNYQCILANTESLLKTLQKSVENEESTWQEKLLEKENLLRQLLVDKKNLTMRVSELSISLQKLQEADELQSNGHQNGNLSESVVESSCDCE